MPGHTYVLIDRNGIVREVRDDPNMAMANDLLVSKIADSIIRLMNALHEPQLAWFLWSLSFLATWFVLYLFLKSKEGRKEMFWVSVLTLITGFTEPFFVPAYWNPPSLFDLAHRTGFDIESFIFAFAVGGIAVVIYEHLFHISHAGVISHEQHLPHHRFHLFAILSMPAIFLLLVGVTSLNPIYSAIIAMTVGGLLSWYCRPDLKRKCSRVQ